MRLLQWLGVILLLNHSLAFAQSDVTGFCKFSVPNGGVRYLELKQTGETLTGSTHGGRQVTLTGTLRDGKPQLEGTVSRPGGNHAIVFDGVLSDPARFNKKVHLVWLGVGTAEPERMHKGLLNFNDFLEQAGIKHVFFESPGTAHEWQTWRRDLNLFAPLLFAPASPRSACKPSLRISYKRPGARSFAFLRKVGNAMSSPMLPVERMLFKRVGADPSGENRQRKKDTMRTHCSSTLTT